MPEYEILDEILDFYITYNLSVEEIIKKGHERKIVEWVIKNIKLNEYKRKQTPVVLKVTTKAFGTGRRIPIASKY